MNREIKLLHTADTHIGYRQYHSDVRRQDFLDAFSAVIDDAIEMKIDAVVHAGDLFDSRNPTLDDVMDTMNILSRLKSADIPFLAIVGNHESKQHTQWLDLFRNMGIAIRLGTVPYEVERVAVYGLDSVAKSKIPLFDYSIFDDAGHRAQSRYEYNLLVMHQLMNPFAFGEWDCEEVIQSLPFKVHALLLGDYHKYEKTKVGDTWVTYCGSTERNSAAERETRSYNIITINSSGIDISRRNIQTREFEFIDVLLGDDLKAHEKIFSDIKEHDVSDKVAFVDISGNPDIAVSFSEVEEFLLGQGALVPRIRDMRAGDGLIDSTQVSVSFSDPDEAVKEEIKKMDLTDAGLVIDELVRDMVIVKTKIDVETEVRIGKLVEGMDFTDPIPNTRQELVSEAMAGETASGQADMGAVVKNADDAKNAHGIVVEANDEMNIGKEVPENQCIDEGMVENTDEQATDEETTDKGTVKVKAKYGTKKTTSVPKQYNLGDYI
ncbi:MAG TPA: exonuclease SbcCD subunit D [Methanosarcinaceae archaeon]|nr:exonuclease SbcCD subunit D [Methanosarcinaceae archaeon]